MEETNWPIFTLKIVVYGYVFALGFVVFGNVIYFAGKGTIYGFFSFMYLMISSFS